MTPTDARASQVSAPESVPRASFCLFYLFIPTKSFACCRRDEEDYTQDWQSGPSREINQTGTL